VTPKVYKSRSGELTHYRIGTVTVRTSLSGPLVCLKCLSVECDHVREVLAFLTKPYRTEDAA
jgi:hypothetical protein